MNLLRDLKVPLFAELDVSNVQNYIATKIDTRLDHINDTLDDKIEALMDDKMTVDNLDKTKLENDERVSGIISDFKSLDEIVKNLKNENNQLREDFKEWKNNGKCYCRLYNIFYYLMFYFDYRVRIILVILHDLFWIQCRIYFGYTVGFVLVIMKGLF